MLVSNISRFNTLNSVHDAVYKQSQRSLHNQIKKNAFGADFDMEKYNQPNLTTNLIKKIISGKKYNINILA